jgi:hypothetical protein
MRVVTELLPNDAVAVEFNAGLKDARGVIACSFKNKLEYPRLIFTVRLDVIV